MYFVEGSIITLTDGITGVHNVVEEEVLSQSIKTKDIPQKDVSTVDRSSGSEVIYKRYSS